MQKKENIALTEAVYYILISLYKPMHGYLIMQNISQLSGGRLSIGPGTLYGALGTLLKKGWIRFCGSSNDKNKKEYIITEPGKSIIKDEISRLEELLVNGKKIMEENGNA